MCFSSTASFGAGIILTAVGVATLSKATNRKELLFAGIPFLFAAQQFIEGVLWISLSNTEYSYFQKPATYLFLGFAQVLWPIWVPFSLLRLEKEEKNRKILVILSMTGIMISTYLLFGLYYYPVNAGMQQNHIKYTFEVPLLIKYIRTFFYFTATVIPPFFSRIPKMKILSLIILVSYVLTAIFFKAYFVSVWCFFAAIISVLVWSIMNDIQIDHRKIVDVNNNNFST